MDFDSKFYLDMDKNMTTAAQRHDGTASTRKKTPYTAHTSRKHADAVGRTLATSKPNADDPRAQAEAKMRRKYGKKQWDKWKQEEERVHGPPPTHYLTPTELRSEMMKELCNREGDVGVVESLILRGADPNWCTKVRRSVVPLSASFAHWR